MNAKMTALSMMIACLAGAVSCATAPPAAPSKPTMAQAAPPAAVPAPKFSTSDTLIGELLDNPETRAVLEQNIPELVNAPQIDMARGMTLKGIQPYAVDTITDQVLAKVDAAFAALSQ